MRSYQQGGPLAAVGPCAKADENLSDPGIGFGY